MDITRENSSSFISEIKKINNWVGYKLEARENGKLGKIPRNPHNGMYAKQNEPSTWGSYEQAKSAVSQYGFDGIGFEFGVQFQGYVGVDLDDVIENGELKPFARDIVEKLDSYTEYSPSNKGLHIICKSDAAMSEWGYQSVSHRDDKLGLEMYDSGRYFTITENIFETPKPIAERTEQLKRVYQKYLSQNTVFGNFPLHSDNLIQPGGHGQDQLYNLYDVIRSIGISATQPLQPEQVPSNTNVNTAMPEEDKNLWQAMFLSHKNGEKIKALFNGDTSAYDNDDSRADLALCSYLAYWTNGDTAMIDRMFRQSKLMRPKWDNPAYRERTIQTALQALQQKTSQAAVPSSQQTPNTIFTGLQPTVPSPVITNNPYLAADSVSAYLDNNFDEDTKKFEKFSKLKTGFANIDSITSFYPELYFLAAEPGLGKTTFCTQLADQLSMRGEHVLYFSFEQSVFELVSKGLSRLTTGYYQNLSVPIVLNNALTATQIRTFGRSDNRVRNAIEQYKSFSMNEIFICNVSSIDKVKEKIKTYIQEKQVSPVVIVDYLQILQSADENRNTTKDVIDNHVWEFKQLQKDYEIPIIMISSLNRANYMNAIDMSSMKESGSLEYSAGVIWGLQLKVLRTMSSDKKENAFEKREKIREAKMRIPREVELVCIKNRCDKLYTCDFQYYANYDLFVPVQQPQQINTLNTFGTARI